MKDERILMLSGLSSVSRRRGGAYKEDSKEGFLNAVWGRMVAASSMIDRWNAMCSPDHYCRLQRTTTNEECMELERRAINKWGALWQRPSFAGMEFPERIGGRQQRVVGNSGGKQ